MGSGRNPRRAVPPAWALDRGGGVAGECGPQRRGGLMAKLDGSCLCGKVTYSCDAEPVATAVCHCTDCQKQTGTAFSIIVGVPTESLRIDGDGLGSFTTVGEDTKQDVVRSFCP